MKRIARFSVCASVLVWLMGCQTPRPRPDTTALPHVQPSSPASDYRLVFPDVVHLEFTGHPEWNGKFLVMPDGTLQHPQLGNIIAEGTTIGELQQRLATNSKLSSPEVRCHVAEFRSRVVTIFQQDTRLPVTIPYAGSELIYDLLQRTQQLGPLNQHDIQIIRRNTANGGQEERLRVDLTAIQAGVADTNIILQPNDEIHITKPETESVFTKLIPTWAGERPPR